MDQAKVEAMAALRDHLEVIARHDPGALAEGKDLGAINFRVGENLFRQIIDLAAELNSLPLDLLPTQVLRQLHGPFGNVAQNLQQIASFTLVGRSNPESERNSLLQQAQQHHDAAVTAVMPYIGYLSTKSAEAQETMRRASELLTKTEQRVDGLIKEIQGKLTEANTTVQAIQAAAGKVGVAKFARRFEEIAATHDKAAAKWLRAAAVSAVLTMTAAVVFIWVLPPSGPISDAATVQRIVAKLLVISVLYYAVLWTSRNYRAHRHLCVVNEHRQNALSTFETFVEASEQKQTRDAVLLEATHCIFAQETTGYLAEDESGSQRIVEILKTGVVGKGDG